MVLYTRHKKNNNTNSTEEVKVPQDHPEIYLNSAGRNAKLFRDAFNAA